MTRALARLRRFFSQVNFICAVLGAALLFLIASIICFEVTVRAFGGSSNLWVIEASEYTLLFITFLGAPYLLEKNMHVVLDLLYDHVTGIKKRLLMIFNAGLGFAVCAILFVVGVQVVMDQFVTGTREVTVMRPLSWWITSALPIGMGLMAVQFLDKLVMSMRGEAS